MNPVMTVLVTPRLAFPIQRAVFLTQVEIQLRVVTQLLVTEGCRKNILRPQLGPFRHTSSQRRRYLILLQSYFFQLEHLTHLKKTSFSLLHTALHDVETLVFPPLSFLYKSSDPLFFERFQNYVWSFAKSVKDLLFTYAAEETTTAATMTISSEKVDLCLCPKKRRIPEHGFGTSAPGKTKSTGAETTDAICRIYEHSDYSKPTIKTSRTGGAGVCSEDSPVQSDSAASCNTSRKNAISSEQQMEELHPTVSEDTFINLPDDLLRNIFNRLSMKDIVRLGSLNTSWRSEVRRILYNEGHIFCRYFDICRELERNEDQRSLEENQRLEASWTAQYQQLHCFLELSSKDVRAFFATTVVYGIADSKLETDEDGHKVMTNSRWDQSPNGC